MRRVLLLALLAAPALSSAQILAPPAGGMSFPDELHSPNDAFINAAECAGHGAVNLRWDAASVSSVTNLATITDYQLYAHNSTTSHNESSPGVCPTNNQEGGDTALVVGAIGSTLAATETNPNGTVASKELSFDATLIVSAAGKSCNATADEAIVLCVQALDGTTKLGAARAKVTLTTRKPGRPTNVDAESGNNALNVSWSAPDGSPIAEYYRIEAVFDSTTTAATDPVLVHTSSAVSVTDGYRFTGLVNTVIYRIQVLAYSNADNVSEPSFVTTGMPELANDFWKAYRAAGGQEQGGCGYGVAGPIALLAVAAGLVILRRRS